MCVGIAKETNITIGKWMLFRTRDKVDDTWEMIKKATITKTLGRSAKVVLYTHTNNTVICFIFVQKLFMIRVKIFLYDFCE